jgi:RNA polymerase sigma-70 factor (ECF subfamily)
VVFLSFVSPLGGGEFVAHHQQQVEQFVADLTGAQSQLYAYILALVADANRAHEILQNANMTIWRKSAEFEPGTNFRAWAGQIAYFEVLADRKRRSLDRHVFDDALLTDVAAQATAITQNAEAKLRMLNDCMKKLAPSHRKLISERYAPCGSVRRIADQFGKSVAAVSQSLYRIRRVLGNCIEDALAKEQTP